jgi:2-polyprenyl-3-methyl-5-hydroxy-6-metoxy-1,4-benzoquinol methylase
MADINKTEYSKTNPFGLLTNSEFHKLRVNYTLTLIKKYLGSGKNSIKILDVGCGTGIITNLIAEEIKNVEIDAFDIAEQAINQAKINGNSKVKYFVADAIQFNSSGKKYDLIILNNIYEHIENPIGALKNLKKYLKEEGVLLISTPNRHNTKNLIRNLIGRKSAISSTHITEYSVNQLKEHMNYVNMNILKIYNPSYKEFILKPLSLLTYFAKPVFTIFSILTGSKLRLNRLVFLVVKNNNR